MRCSVWIGLGKSAVRFGLEKCQNRIFAVLVGLHLKPHQPKLRAPLIKRQGKTANQTVLRGSVWAKVRFELENCQPKPHQPQLRTSLIKRQGKTANQTVLRGSIWVGLGKSVMRFGLEKCQNHIFAVWVGLHPKPH